MTINLEYRPFKHNTYTFDGLLPNTAYRIGYMSQRDGIISGLISTDANGVLIATLPKFSIEDGTQYQIRLNGAVVIQGTISTPKTPFELMKESIDALEARVQALEANNP